MQKVTVSTVAGSGVPGLADGLARAARFKSPLDVTVMADGSIYVADGFNSCIRKIRDGKVTTFAGNGNANIKNGNGTNARFKIPCRMASDIDNNIYLLDAADPRLRKITPFGDVSFYAGASTFGYHNGDANNAQFGQGFGIVADAQKNIYIADSQNNCIRKISLDGTVTTFAGTGRQGLLNGDTHTAEFFFIKGMVIDKQDNLLVADLNRVRKVSQEGSVSTFFFTNAKGDRNEALETSRFSQIEDMVMDEHENIYLTEGNRILKVTPQGNVSTVAGSSAGYRDGDAEFAKFNGPRGLAIDKEGNIYVADSNNNSIRKISF